VKEEKRLDDFFHEVGKMGERAVHSKERHRLEEHSCEIGKLEEGACRKEGGR
jgi:hypothetical protein